MAMIRKGNGLDDLVRGSYVEESRELEHDAFDFIEIDQKFKQILESGFGKHAIWGIHQRVELITDILTPEQINSFILTTFNQFIFR